MNGDCTVLKPELLRLTEKRTIYIDLLLGYLAIRLRPDSSLSVLLKLGYLLSVLLKLKLSQ